MIRLEFLCNSYEGLIRQHLQLQAGDEEQKAVDEMIWCIDLVSLSGPNYIVYTGRDAWQ